jgi:hypothetical protein
MTKHRTGPLREGPLARVAQTTAIDGRAGRFGSMAAFADAVDEVFGDGRRTPWAGEL